MLTGSSKLALFPGLPCFLFLNGSRRVVGKRKMWTRGGHKGGGAQLQMRVQLTL